MQGGPKIGTLFSYALTSSNIDQISNFISLLESGYIFNNTLTKDPTTPQVRRYNTMRNVSVLKITAENKTTSVTTHFKSASSSSKTDTLKFDVKTA